MRTTWQAIKAATWSKPLTAGIMIWSGILAAGVTIKEIADWAGHPSVGEYMYGFMVGASVYRFALFTRWNRMRKYRAYVDEQARKRAPRTGAYSNVTVLGGDHCAHGVDDCGICS